MIRLDQKNDVAVITMDDGKVNAANTAFLKALNEAFDEAEKSAKAIVLAGREGVFSAGFDLQTMKSEGPSARGEMTAIGSATVSRLFGSKLPIIAAVTGHAFALGAVLNAACDYSVGAKGEFKYAVNETAIGEVFPPWGYEVLLSRLTKEYVYPAAVLSVVLDVEQALKANFIQEAVEVNEVLPRAIQLAEDMAKLPSDAYWVNKSVIRGSAIERVAASVGAF